MELSPQTLLLSSACVHISNTDTISNNGIDDFNNGDDNKHINFDDDNFKTKLNDIHETIVEERDDHSHDIKTNGECHNDTDSNDVQIDGSESKSEGINGDALIPTDGIIQPPFIPPDDRPLRYTNHLQMIRQTMSKYVFRFRSAAPFLQPVNCVALKIPHYYKVITNPMDLGTIKKRLEYLWYQSSAECFADIKLMVNNCYVFNRPDDYVYQSGQKLEKYIDEKLSVLRDLPEVDIACPSRPKIDSAKVSQSKRKSDAENFQQNTYDSMYGQSGMTLGRGRVVTRSDHGLLAKRPNKDLPVPLSASNPQFQLKKVPLSPSQRMCLDIVKEMMSKKHMDYAWPFYEPVNVTAFPEYLNVIKKPIDLSTIKMKLETGQYRTALKFAADMRLMFSNCLRFNAPDIPVVEMARKLREFFEFRFAKIPDELLEEKSLIRNDRHHQHHEKSKAKDSGMPVAAATESTPNEARMRTLETQVKLLTDAIGAVLTTNRPSVQNGDKKRRVTSAKRKQNNGQNNGQRKKRKIDTKPVKTEPEPDYDDSDDDESAPIVPAPVLSPETFGFEEMAQLKTDLESLDADSLRRVLKILQASEPSIRCEDDNELEIDFEVLKTSTLIELRKYVSSCMLNNVSKKGLTNGSDAKKKKKHSAGTKTKTMSAKNCDNTNSLASSSGVIPNQLSLMSSRLSESSSSDDSDNDSSSDSDSNGEL